MASIVAVNYPHLITALGVHSGTVFGAGHSIIGAYGVMQRGALKSLPDTIANIAQKYPVFPTMPVMLIQGLQDNVVRPINTVQLTQQFKALNRVDEGTKVRITTMAASEPDSKNPHSSYTMQEYYQAEHCLIRVCEIPALGHAWSGGDCSLRYNACEGPDATQMLWDFLRISGVLPSNVVPVPDVGSELPPRQRAQNKSTKRQSIVTFAMFSKPEAP